FILDHYLLPELGDIPIHKLDSERLDQFLIQEMEHGSACSPGCGALAAKTVSDHKTVLLSVFRYAYSRKYVTAVPECMPIPHEQPHIRVLTKKEQKLLEQAALEADTPICFAIFLSLYAGLRIGEACALRWEDFDFTNGTVMVNKTVIRIRNTDSSRPGKSIVIIDRPKTRCSNRIIPLADPILNYLRPRCREPFIYVATGTPNYIEPRLCLKHYKKILKQAGIADYNYHALRHTFATRCIENGFDIKSLSEIMGHSSVNVTMQRYVHPSLDLKKEQMNRLSNLTVWNQE
ncbi:MAG: site-specific integrase, partial [Lachnospiraceae bacterium]|nr:site-specific integrase [Lachnospiraceae bacterium]